MMPLFVRAAALSIFAIFSQTVAVQARDSRDPVVEAPAGAVRGVMRDGQHIFKAIPYAAPPVGELRWKPPAPLPAWDEVLDAAKFGPACMQPTGRQGSIYAEKLSGVSEDCLTLNIWKPENAQNAPVFLWIHGGSLRAGASSQSLYDGAALAKQGMVVVSINYRLGLLGYMAHPELSAESPEGVSGNYGLLDQIAALEWVQENIESFGGDPENVTVAGESAGALSVMYLMASPPAHGLFAKAIAQSAYMISTPALREPSYGMPPAESIGTYVADKLGATDIAAMREMSAADIIFQSGKAGYIAWGTIDGVILPDELVDVFDRGEQAQVPILAGFNSGEIRSLRFLLPKAPASAEKYEELVRTGYGELAEAFLEQYPSKTLAESMLATTRDAMYGWTAERLARKQTEIGKPSFLYIFNHGYPAANKLGLHAFHASELPYVFGTLKRTTDYWPTPPKNKTERDLSKAMLGYWASFAKDGQPAAPGFDDWAAYSSDEAYMYFSDGPHGGATNLLPGMYELHEEVVCRRRAAGDMAWNWNVGVASPSLPPRAPGCR